MAGEQMWDGDCERWNYWRQGAVGSVGQRFGVGMILAIGCSQYMDYILNSYNIMQREQSLKRYLSHLLSLPTDKFPQLLKCLTDCGKEYGRHSDQGGFLKVLRVDLQKNKRNRSRQLIRFIYIFDTLIKDVRAYRQPISHIIGQIYVQLFSIFFESNFQAEIEDMKMIRKSWATLIPDSIIEKIQKEILLTHNFNLDKGFSKKKIQELKKYYTTIKLTPEIYDKYLPSRENTKSNQVNIEQFSDASNEEPVARKRKVITEMPVPLAPTHTHQPLQSHPMQYQHNPYQHNPYPNSYQTNPAYMYQMQMQQYNQLPMQQMQQMQHMQQMPPMQTIQPPSVPPPSQILQGKNPQYYYPNNMHMGMSGGYNNYYPNHMNTYNMNMPPPNPYKPPQQFQNRYPQPKTQQIEQSKKGKSTTNSKYKELLTFGRYRCPCCGMISNKRDYFDLHLKSHFQDSKKDYENIKKQAPLKRTPALDVKDWLPKEVDENEVNCFVEMSKYPQNRCKLCSNIFEPTWDASQEKWIFKDVVLVELDNTQCSMHYPCFTALNGEAKNQ